MTAAMQPLGEAQPTLASVRGFVLEVARDLDPGSRYIRELLAVLDASTDIEDYLARLQDPDRTDFFRLEGSRVSQGERGYSWLDPTTWGAMDVYERTLANLVTGETRMMWAGDGASDFARFADAVVDRGPVLRVLPRRQRRRPGRQSSNRLDRHHRPLAASFRDHNGRAGAPVG
jgi:hypothetical protein